MTRLRSWHEHCASLFKARKPAKLTDVAARLDEHFGPWPQEMGSRAEAAAHVESIGRAKALTLAGSAPGTPEHKAHTFVTDQKKFARAHSSRNAVPAFNDTLTGPIDKDHVEHYSNLWATHNTLLEHSDRGKKIEVANEDGDAVQMRTVPRGRAPMQLRTYTTALRVKAMRAAGHAEPFATPDDLKTLHAGVEHAIHSGAVSESDANRYHVMRAAVGKVERQHADAYPGLPFKPSWAAMDTGALRAMRAGADHLHHAGFPDAKDRLGSVLSSALDSHDKHPFTPKLGDENRSRPYPALHRIGSKQHQLQERSWAQSMATLDKRRGIASEQPATPTPAKTAQAAAPKPIELPASYADYKSRSDRGETFAPEVHTKMERMRMQERQAAKAAKVEKAFSGATLYKALLAWRRSAA